MFILQTWYVTSRLWFYNSFLETIATVEGTFAVREMIRNIKRPLFQDYTLQGRAIGFGLRIVRICLGGLAYSIVAVGYLIAYAIWLLFPVICLVSLVGSLLGYSSTPSQEPLL